MSLSSYNGHSNFTIKGKKFIKRGADNIYDIASVAGTSGNFSSGWVNEDPSGTDVGDGATLTFNHNLGTTDVTVDIYVSANADGSSSRKLNTDIGSSGTAVYGPQIQNVTASSLTLQLSSGGYIELLSNGTRSGQTSFTNKYIKVVASAGGGAARASGTIVATNGTSSAGNYSASSWSLTSGALNVASMTQAYSSGSGRYGIHNAQFTITFSSPISRPIPIVTCENMGSYTVPGYTNTAYSHRQRVTFSNSNATTQSPLSNAFENQEFDTMLIYQGYNMPAWTSFVIF